MENSHSPEERKHLQALLRDLRKGAGLKQSDVADKLRVPQSFVSKYESGERRLDVIELRHVLHVLQTDLESFAARLTARIEGRE